MMIHVMHIIFVLTFSLSIFLYRVILICSKCKTACKQFRAYCGQNKFSLTSLFRSYQHIRDYVTAATHCRNVVFHENPRGLSFFLSFATALSIDVWLWSIYVSPKWKAAFAAITNFVVERNPSQLNCIIDNIDTL